MSRRNNRSPPKQPLQWLSHILFICKSLLGADINTKTLRCGLLIYYSPWLKTYWLAKHSQCLILLDWLSWRILSAQGTCSTSVARLLPSPPVGMRTGSEKHLAQTGNLSFFEDMDMRGATSKLLNSSWLLEAACHSFPPIGLVEKLLWCSVCYFSMIVDID